MLLIEMDFPFLLVTSCITSSLLFPLPVSWPCPASILLSLVTPFSMYCPDLTLDRRNMPASTTVFQHNDTMEHLKVTSLYLDALCSPLELQNSFLVALTCPFTMQLDILKACHIHTIKHAELGSRWGKHVEKLWRSCKFKLRAEGETNMLPPLFLLYKGRWWRLPSNTTEIPYTRINKVYSQKKRFHKWWELQMLWTSKWSSVV